MDLKKETEKVEAALKAVAWKRIWVYVKFYVLNVAHALQHVLSALAGKSPDVVLFGRDEVYPDFKTRAQNALKG
jgi:hypothetical protein